MYCCFRLFHLLRKMPQSLSKPSASISIASPYKLWCSAAVLHKKWQWCSSCGSNKMRVSSLVHIFSSDCKIKTLEAFLHYELWGQKHLINTRCVTIYRHTGFHFPVSTLTVCEQKHKPAQAANKLYEWVFTIYHIHQLTVQNSYTNILYILENSPHANKCLWLLSKGNLFLYKCVKAGTGSHTHIWDSTKSLGSASARMTLVQTFSQRVPEYV